MDLNEKNREARARVLSSYQQKCDGVAALLESPIEVALFWALLEIGSEWGQPRVELNTEWGADSWFHIHTEAEEWSFFVQRKVEVSGRKYRLDFHAQADTFGGCRIEGPEVPSVKAAIECDGHDFHERTREQASRDRKRDRDLQAAGYLVLRYTGSDIYRDARAVAQEIVDTLNAKAAEVFDAWMAANHPRAAVSEG